MPGSMFTALRLAAAVAVRRMIVVVNSGCGRQFRADDFPQASTRCRGVGVPAKQRHSRDTSRPRRRRQRRSFRRQSARQSLLGLLEGRRGRTVGHGEGAAPTAPLRETVGPIRLSKPLKIYATSRARPSLLAALKKLAEREHRSVSNLLELLLEKAIREAEKQKPNRRRGRRRRYSFASVVLART
jgi:hypothetical protein